MIQIHSGETSQPWDFVACLVAAQPHTLKLASLTFKILWEVECTMSNVSYIVGGPELFYSFIWITNIYLYTKCRLLKNWFLMQIPELISILLEMLILLSQHVKETKAKI